MKREASIGKETSAEALLGLKEKLLEKTSPIPDPVVRVKKANPFVIIAAGGEIEEVSVVWRDSGSFNGGQIALHYGERLDERADALAGEPKMVVSFFQVHEVWDKAGDFWRTNPQESLSTVLTTISTINRAALKAEEKILHVARANKESRPYFQRFVGSGLYYYCDRDGKRVEEPVEVDDQLLFACEYPVEGLREVLDKFVIPEAVSSLVQLRAKVRLACKDSSPSSS